jgi:predicted DNA-binding antitoxin AbrB/MazE fold protein
MSVIAAVYRHGVFEPLEPVHLPEEEQVEVHIVSSGKAAWEAWIRKTQARHSAFIKKHGLLPDSTPDIAEDRRR